jgi:hypothetical protein
MERTEGIAETEELRLRRREQVSNDGSWHQERVREVT